MENTKTNAIRIILFCIFVGAIVIAMSMVVGGTKTGAKYTSFAQCISAKKAKFYGAFWCPHCQTQKTAFGDGEQYLPYIESSNPDRSQNQVGLDAKIENYPTWVYSTEITMTSKEAPLVCSVQPGPVGEPAACANSGSRYFKTWIFKIDNSNETVKIQSEKDPVKSGDSWIFAAGSRSVGELDTKAGFEILSGFTGCSLPQEDPKK
jgi:hypothetical protein